MDLGSVMMPLDMGLESSMRDEAACLAAEQAAVSVWIAAVELAILDYEFVVLLRVCVSMILSG